MLLNILQDRSPNEASLAPSVSSAEVSEACPGGDSSYEAPSASAA